MSIQTELKIKNGTVEVMTDEQLKFAKAVSDGYIFECRMIPNNEE